MELDFRKSRILACIIETHIHTGEPVGSKALAEMLGNSRSDTHSSQFTTSMSPR